MRLRFWGVRGSVPWTVRAAMGHGCNTPCIEITDDGAGHTLILDAGSGLVGLGQALDGPPRELPILLSHYHWDHLQGLPFLAQIYTAGWQPRVFAPSLEAPQGWLETLFGPPFFPIPAASLPSPPAVETIATGDLKIGGFAVSAVPLNHPGGALGYRIGGAAGDVVYATDHEFGNPRYDEPLAAFARGAAALVLDAHFADDEFPSHTGWGHSTWRQCAEFAARVEAGGLWLFHHKPGRTDDALARIRADARRIFPATDTAREGDALEI